MPAVTAQAAAPGITGTTFSLNAGPGYNSQPDGELIYSWGYGCTAGFTPTYAPAIFASIGKCPTMQMPGPTLVVTEGTTFTVTLTNSLPAAAGNTSILFPGLTVTTSGTGPQGLLTQEAVPGGTVTYTVTAAVGTAGTHAYYSGTQPDLQIEMGLFGAVIVKPATTYTNCTAQEKPLPDGSGEKACKESKIMCTSGPKFGAPCALDQDCGLGSCGSSCNPTTAKTP